MPTINMESVKKIMNGNKRVKKIEDSNSNLLWKGYWEYTIKLGNYVSVAKYSVDNTNWTDISSNTKVTVYRDETLYIQAKTYSSEPTSYQYSYSMSNNNFEITRSYSNDGGEVTISRTATPTTNTYSLIASCTNATVTFYSDSNLSNQISSASYGSTVYYYCNGNTGYNNKSGSLTVNENDFSLNTGNLTASVDLGSVSLQTFTITFINEYNSNQNQSGTWNYGDTPSYSGTPTRSADNYNTYTFAGWTPSVSTVTGNATYTAVWTPKPIPYTITWRWQSSYGTWTTTTETYYYGNTPSRANPSDVTSGNNKQVCNGWDDLSTVTANRTITATYQQQYYIEIGRVRCTCPSSDGWYNAGESITFTANSNCAFNSNGTQTTYSPTINSGGYYEGSADYVYCLTSGTHCSANKSGWLTYGETITWTADSHYHFGSSNSTTTITDSAIPESISKTANINTYTITWKNYDNSTLITQPYFYGETPSYPYNNPTRSGYKFTGWSPTITTVTGDKTYTAQYTILATPKKSDFKVWIECYYDSDDSETDSCVYVKNTFSYTVNIVKIKYYGRYNNTLLKTDDGFSGSISSGSTWYTYTGYDYEAWAATIYIQYNGTTYEFAYSHSDLESWVEY